MSDAELFPVRNNFFIGNYQQCITESQRLDPSSEDAALERDIYMYRAYIAQKKYNTVKSEITARSPTALQAVRVLALYMQNPKGQGPEAIKTIEDWLVDEVLGTNDTIKLVAGTIYLNENNFDDAMRALHGTNNLECIALMIHSLIKIDRVQIAAKELARMQSIDDDSTITQLAHAWVNLGLGNEKYQEAYYIYQELCEKFAPTVTLLNGQAACYIHTGKFADAESLLLEAFERDASNPETLINLVVVSQHMGKAPEMISRYINQLKDECPEHPYVKDHMAKEEMFERTCPQYAAAAN
eukprot:Nk52_evm7s2241 gene=Nk52_evmTU7s2241